MYLYHCEHIINIWLAPAMAKYMSLKFRWQITFYIWIKAFKCLTRNFNQLEQLFCSTFLASPHPRSLLPRLFRFFIVVVGGNKRANIFMLLKQLPFVHCQSSSVVLKSKKLLPFQHRLEPLNICRSVRWIYLNCKETFIQIFCNIFFSALSSFFLYSQGVGIKISIWHISKWNPLLFKSSKSCLFTLLPL